MFKQEIAIGDYISLSESTLNINAFMRSQMVQLIEELGILKHYKLETVFTAVSLADRYLVTVTVKRGQAPCLITLAVTCVLIAAKIEQPVSPNFGRLLKVLRE